MLWAWVSFAGSQDEDVEEVPGVIPLFEMNSKGFWCPIYSPLHELLCMTMVNRSEIKKRKNGRLWADDRGAYSLLVVSQTRSNE